MLGGQILNRRNVVLRRRSLPVLILINPLTFVCAAAHIDGANAALPPRRRALLVEQNRTQQAIRATDHPTPAQPSPDQPSPAQTRPAEP